MSLPSLRDVLRNIYQGEPAKGGRAGTLPRRERANSMSALNKGRVNAVEERPVRGREERRQQAGGQRRRRQDFEMDSDNSWDSPAPSTPSAYSEASGSTAAGADASTGGWNGSTSSYDGSECTWDGTGDPDGHGLVVTPNGSGSSNGSTYNSQKRARFAPSRSLSMHAGGGNGDGRESGVGGGGKDRTGLVRSKSVLESGYRQHSQSHSTEEWRAVQKAARVLGVDSLEERDVEDRQRFSTRKAAQVLGVENVEEVREMQESATGRQKWAPPRSSASKAARMLGVDDVSVLEERATSRGRGRRSRSSSRHQRSSSVPKDGRTAKAPGISSLIRALEIGSASQHHASVGDGGKEGSAGEMGISPHSSATRRTESCSSASDVTIADRETDSTSIAQGALGSDSGSSSSSAAAAVAAAAAAAEAHAMSRYTPEPADDQIAGLQTPAQRAAAEAGSGGSYTRGRDDMEVETPPAQPRSAALASLTHSPAPLHAPYILSGSGANRLPRSPQGPGPSPSGSPLSSARLPPYGMMSGAPPNTVGMRCAPGFPVGNGTTSGSDGDRSTPPSPLVLAEGRDDFGGDGAAADEKTSPPRRMEREAIGDGPDRGVGWARPASAPIPSQASPDSSSSPNAAAAAAAVAAARERASRSMRDEARKNMSTQSMPLPSPIEPSAGWGRGWSTSSAFAVAGAKETPHQVRSGSGHGVRGGRGGEEYKPSMEYKAYMEHKPCMEYKQEAPMTAVGGECYVAPARTSPREVSRSHEYPGYGHASGWGSAREAPAAEFKHESNGPAPGDWPARPSSAPIPGAPQQRPRPQPPFTDCYSPGVLVEPPHPMVSSPPTAAFSMGVGGGGVAVEGGVPPAREGSGGGGSGGSGSGSGGSGAGKGSYSALAALIPFVNPANPMGIGSSPPVPVGLVNQKDVRIVPQAAAVGPATKSKSRRRSTPKGGQTMVDSSAVVTPVDASPVPTVPPDGVIGSSADVAAASGVSSRKQREVATRPREKGRFVKRPPAFLPISAFKPAGSKTEADIAAERAEEAREEAVEAAARAAAAAAAAAAGKQSDVNPPSSSSSSGASAAATSAAKLPVFSPPTTPGMPTSKDSSAPAPAPAPWSTGGSSGGSGGGSGSGSAGRSRNRERDMSPPSPRSKPGIWTKNDGEDDGDNPGGGGGGGGSNSALRERSMSDCESERGSDDLRGMAFLRSPVGVEGHLWDSPRYGGFSVTGSSGASTPSSTQRHRGARGGDGSRMSGMHSPRSTTQLSDVSLPSTADSEARAPWAGTGEAGAAGGGGGGGRMI